MSLSKNVGPNLRRTRLAAKLTQEELAERAGITVSYTSMLERGRRTPPLDTLEALARALRVDPLSLLRAA